MPNKMFIPLGILVASTLISGGILASSNSSALQETANATVTVTSACTMTNTGDSTHSITALAGNYYTVDGAILKTVCNDSGGYALYAIGSSNNIDGGSNLIGATTGLTIPTGTATGDVSNWSMKLAKDTNGYNPANLTITSGYTNYHAVPNSQTMVASFAGATDTTKGSVINTSYAVRVAGNQPADTYTGKVKYTMVHPSGAAPTVASQSGE